MKAFFISNKMCTFSIETIMDMQSASITLILKPENGQRHIMILLYIGSSSVFKIFHLREVKNIFLLPLLQAL